MKINNRWKIILTVVAFNLLFEIALRGLGYFLTNPWLLFFIFPVYFVIFTFLEDFIGRFKLNDYQFMLTALIVWYTNQLIFFSGDSFFFMPPFFLGINWQQFIWLSLVWYIALQPVMGFYIANRLFPRQDYQPLLSRRGWIVWSLLFVTTGLVWRLGTLKAKAFPSPQGYLVLLIITLILIVIAKRIWPRGGVKILRLQKHRVMDILSLATLVVFAYFALFTRLDPSRAAYNLVDYQAVSFKVIILWTTISAIIMFGYRLYSHKPIPI